MAFDGVLSEPGKDVLLSISNLLCVGGPCSKNAAWLIDDLKLE